MVYQPRRYFWSHLGFDFCHFYLMGTFRDFWNLSDLKIYVKFLLRFAFWGKPASSHVLFCFLLNWILYCSICRNGAVPWYASVYALSCLTICRIYKDISCRWITCSIYWSPCYTGFEQCRYLTSICLFFGWFSKLFSDCFCFCFCFCYFLLRILMCLF